MKKKPNNSFRVLIYVTNIQKNSMLFKNKPLYFKSLKIKSIVFHTCEQIFSTNYLDIHRN